MNQDSSEIDYQIILSDIPADLSVEDKVQLIMERLKGKLPPQNGELLESISTREGIDVIQEQSSQDLISSTMGGWLERSPRLSNVRSPRPGRRATPPAGPQPPAMPRMCT